jgi:peptidoglycan/LPS O-acetylase OafA/YrhL
MKIAKGQSKYLTPDKTINANFGHGGFSYYPLFDWLRITLAIVVALGHDNVINWPHAGNLAVQVFFALSGWLIGGILLSTKKEALPKFFFNRVTRIWVPYALAITLLLGASLLRDPVTPKWLEFVFYKLTFVYNFFGAPQLAQFRQQMPLAGTGNHFWSICAEEQFYLLAPLIIVLIPGRTGKSLTLWLFISVVAVSVQAYGSIALGVTAAVFKYYFGDWHLDIRAIIILLAALLISVVYITFGLAPYIYVAPFFSVLTVLLLARFGVKTFLGQFVGGMSYPFYLNHWIGVFTAHEILEPFGLREAPVSKVLALVLNLIVAAVLYLIIDNNIRKYRASWFTNRRGIYSSFAAYSLMAVGLTGGLIIFNGW